MKHRRNNKKLAIILGASAVALGTVGFASWVINEQAQIDVQNVTVTFGDVNDTSVVATLKDQDLALAFDAQTDNQGKVQSNDGAEDLVFSFTYEIRVGSSVKLTGVKFDIEDIFSGLSDAKYIQLPYAATQTVTLDEATPAGTYIPDSTFKTYSKGEAKDALQSHVVSVSDNTYSFVSTFTFKWGDTFNNVNPSKADDVGTPNKADAIVTSLNAFKTAYEPLKAKTLNVTITPVTK